MEYKVNIPVLDKRFNVDVDYYDSYKSKKNRYFANASPYAKGGRLVQKKFCSVTGKEVQRDEVTHKLFKVGKEYIPIPKDRLKGIKDRLQAEGNEIEVKKVIKRENFELPYERIDSTKYVKPAKKSTKDYIELRELGKTHILIGEAIFKSNEYEVAMLTINDTLVIVKFATQDRMRQKPNLKDLKDISINPELIKLERELLDKNVVNNHDWSQFADKRQEEVDILIEKIALGEELPEMPETPEKESATSEEDELERLKKLLKKRKGVEA